jgi:predicted transposase YbfD/YdcC
MTRWRETALQRRKKYVTNIENQLHWVLDVGFQEDSIRTCSGHSIAALHA